MSPAALALMIRANEARLDGFTGFAAYLENELRRELNRCV